MRRKCGKKPDGGRIFYQILKKFAPLVIAALKEKNIDVSEKIPDQLTQEMVKDTEKIISLTEKKYLPDFLVNSKELVYWKIEDGIGKDYEFHVNMRNQIEKLVKELIAKVG